jgi:NAD(P) transhydrogenase subunit alpha
LEKERAALKDHVANSDIVFCAALVPNRIAPVLVTEEMVRSMKPGSVLADVSIDQGGNCALTVPGETAKCHGVNIIGIKNIPGMIPASATWMFASNMYQLLKYLLNGEQHITLNKEDEIVREILTVCDGKVVHAGALEAMA